MSNYGLYVVGADNIYQLDSSDVSTFYLGVYADSSTSHTSGYSQISAWEDGDFVFVKPKSNLAANKDVRFLNTGGVLRLYTQVDYVLCKVAKNTNFADQTGVNYGIEVKNDRGDYVFTSQKINKGMEVAVIKDENSCAGGGSLVGPPATNNIIYQAPSGENINNVWFGSASSMSSTDGYTFVFGGAWYDYTNNRILFQQWMDLSQTIVNGSNYEAFPNGGKLLAGVLHQ